jgi:hypothetical protein
MQPYSLRYVLPHSHTVLVAETCVIKQKNTTVGAQISTRISAARDAGKYGFTQVALRFSQSLLGSQSIQPDRLLHVFLNA